MFFPWLNRLRRSQVLAGPFPVEWLPCLEKNVTLYRTLTEKEQARLRDDVRVFLAEKNWEGCGGLEITDEIKVTIAAQACLLLLGLEQHDYFARVLSILVYPHSFQIPIQMQGTEVIFDDQSAADAQAIYRGPVILSWEHVLAERPDPSQWKNAGLHTFTPQLARLHAHVTRTAQSTPP